MKKLFISVPTVVLMLLIPLLSSAQYVVQKVDGSNVNTSSNGFYYSLPRTIFKIDVTFEIVQRIEGPLANYTEQYLGTTNYIKKNNRFSHILDVKVHPITVADPNETYWVQFPVEKSKEIVMEAFTLSKLGTLLAFDDINTPKRAHPQVEKEMLVFSDHQTQFAKEATYNLQKKIDTVVRKITIDTVTIHRFLFKTSWVHRSEEEKANDAAKQIATLRSARYNLLTGFQEVNYGESIKYMDVELQKLERQYLELFLGKETKSLQSKSFVFIPSKSHDHATLMDYVNANGTHQSVSIRVDAEHLVKGVADSPASKIDNIYYRIPVTATVTVNAGTANLFQNIFPIPQMGAVSAVPLGKNKLHFDFETGTLTKIVKNSLQFLRGAK